uniref:Uncharacterized protein n=1 Tax=Globodera rostochiensis TaxID=31243 RepID=A0A914IDJ2_GLORO
MEIPHSAFITRGETTPRSDNNFPSFANGRTIMKNVEERQLTQWTTGPIRGRGPNWKHFSGSKKQTEDGWSRAGLCRNPGRERGMAHGQGAPRLNKCEIASQGQPSEGDGT